MCVYIRLRWESQKERDNYEDQDVRGRIIFRWMLKKQSGGGMDRIHLAEDRGPWRDLVNKVMNLRVTQSSGKFLSSLKTGGFSRRAQLHGVS
jgi:hypothetical protein